MYIHHLESHDKYFSTSYISCHGARGAGQKNFEPHLFTPSGAWTPAPAGGRRSRRPWGPWGMGAVAGGGNAAYLYGLYIYG